MLIQAEDKRLSPHEETGAAWRKNRFIQGYKCHVGGRREKWGEEGKANDVLIKRESGGSRQTGQAFLTSLMR